MDIQPKGRKEIVSAINNEAHEIKGLLNCESNFVIYILECPWGLQYMGRTTQILRERVNKHRFNIKHKFMKHSISHLFASQHDGNPDLLPVNQRASQGHLVEI